MEATAIASSGPSGTATVTMDPPLVHPMFPLVNTMHQPSSAAEKPKKKRVSKKVKRVSKRTASTSKEAEGAPKPQRAKKAKQLTHAVTPTELLVLDATSRLGGGAWTLQQLRDWLTGIHNKMPGKKPTRSC